MVACAVASIAASEVRAANIAYSLTPANANFSGINWTSGVTVPGAATVAASSGDALYFGGTPTFTTLTNDLTGATFAGLTFNSGSAPFTIGGNAFTLSAALTNNSTATQTINTDLTLAVVQSFNANTGTIVLGGVSSGAGGINKTGTGILTLAGANTYTGNLRVNTGTVTVTGSLADTSSVTAAGGVYNVAVNDTVGVVVQSAGTISGAGILTGSSYGLSTTTTSLTSVTLAGPGALTKTGSGIATLSAANTYTGLTTVNGGTLSVTGSLADTDAVTVASGVYDVAASDTVGVVTVTNATISGVGTLSPSSISFGNTGGPAITATVSAKLGGTGTLTKAAGSGTVLLSGANTYSGGTTLTAGRIQITNASALGTGTVTQSGAATLELNLTGTNTVANTFAPITPGNVTVSGGTITAAAAPTILNTAGTNTISSNVTLANATGGNGFSFGSNAGLLTIAGNISSLRTAAIISAAIGGAGNGVVSGQILDNGTAQVNVLKYGAGTWALTGSNAYATTTSVIGGTLITGNTSALGSSAVSVTNAGTDLKVGNGTANTVSGLTGLTMADSTVLDITAINSQIALYSGVFTLGNITLNLNNAFSSLPANQDFILIDGVDGANAIGNVAFTGTNAAYTYTFGVVGNDGVLSVTGVTAVPEPTTLMAVGLGALVALRRRRTA